MDEPTAGLDITSARTVRTLVKKLKHEGGIVIYSTHQLAEAQQVCDRIIIIHNGGIMADGKPAELIDSTQSSNLEDAYVKLTQEAARPRIEENDDDGKVSKWWTKLLTPNLPRSEGGLEDE